MRVSGQSAAFPDDAASPAEAAGAAARGLAGTGDAVAAAQAGLGWLAGVDAAALPVAEQAGCLRELERAEAMLTAARARVLAAFAAQRGYQDDGQYAPRGWLFWQSRVTRGAAGGAVAWMRRLAAHPRVAEALAAGEISGSWARQVCEWTDRLPEENRDDADQILLAAAAAGADLADLGGLAEEMCRRLAPPDADGADDGFRDRDFRLLLHWRGSSKPAGNFSPELTAALAAALDVLAGKTGPEDERTQGERNHDALEEICHRVIAGGLPATAGQPTQVQLHMTLDQLRDLPGAAAAEAGWAARRGAAAAAGETGWAVSRAAAQAYACDAQITPVVTGRIDPAALAAMTAAFLHGDSAAAAAAAAAGGPAAGGCPAGARCPYAHRPLPGQPAAPSAPARARRRLHDALARRAADVLSGPDGLASFLRTSLLAAEFPPSASLPLDVGAAVSTVPPHLRRAVVARDRHCSFPGCRQWPARCHVHHLIPRSEGGTTSLGNCILLCRFHHLIVIHRWGWTLTLNADATTTAASPDRRKTLHSHGPPEPVAAA